MSGFFQRLTGSARGERPVLRPTAPVTAYLAQPIGNGLLEEAPTGPLLAEPAETTRPNETAGPSPVTPVDRPETPKAATVETAVRGDVTRSRPAETAADTEAEAERKPSEQPGPRERVEGPPAQPLRPGIEEGAALPHPAQDAPTARQPGPAGPDRVEPDPAVVPRSASQPRALPAPLRSPPETLLVPQPTAEPARPRFATPRQTADGRTEGRGQPSPAEVRISIGRIEITAQPPAAAAEQPTRKHEPVSLERYLAERDRGQR